MDVHADGAWTPQLTVRSEGRPDVDDPAGMFAAWIRPHWDVLHRIAARLCGPGDCDDVLQDALSAAWRKRSQYDEARGPARAWLIAIVTDQAIKHGRRTRLRRSRQAADGRVETVAPADPAASLDVWRAVRRLSDRQRLAVALFYYADLSLVDVATAMDCSAGTVKSTLSDARRRLAEILGDDYR